MLYSYKISNFLSIKYDEQINFKAKPYKSNKKTISNNLVPLIGLYGPNGGGKSAFIKSISALLNFILINMDVRALEVFFLNVELLKNSVIKEKPIKWETSMISEEGRIYEYTLEINNKEVVYESLKFRDDINSTKDILVFERTNIIMNLGPSFKGVELNNNCTIGSLLSFLNSNIKNEYINEFYNLILKIKIYNNLLNDPVSINVFSPFKKINYNLNHGVLEKEKDKILQILKDVDINIIDYTYKQDINGIKHLVLKKKNEEGTFEINFANESDGTKKIVELISYFVGGIHDGFIFIMDELDLRLHTKLLGYILNLFHNDINKNSQLIFSSHDMNTLSPEYLRKDEVYFVGLNESYFTNIICLSDLKDGRDSSSYSNKYLKGEFGYDPYVQTSFKWCDEKNE